MRFSSLLLCGLVLTAAVIISSEAQTTLVKKTTLKKKTKKANKAKLHDDIFTPDSEMGTDCYDSCYPNSTFLDAQGKIKDPKQYGDFTEHCGKTYLFSQKKVTWQENWKTCCSIGMAPVIFDTRTEFDCLAKAAEDATIPILKGNNFWVGGYQHGLNNFWYWCTKDSPELIDRNFMYDFLTPPEKKRDGSRSSKDRVKSPFENYKCALISFKDVNTILTNFLCDNANTSNLACESVEKYPQDLLPDTKCKARCETQNCVVNKTLFTKPKNKQELRLKERYKYGRWVSRCGRYFLFTNKTATYDEARKKCCSYGTSLVSMKTAAKRACLTGVAKEYVDVAGEYWTSGSDAECDGNYRWCSVDRAFLKKEIQWAKGQPKSADGDCVWVRANKNSKLTSIYTGNCKKKRKFICEVRQSGTTVQAVQKECIELLGLTKKEVSSLKNTTHYTYKMKCYLKCIGDNLGMMVNGTLQEGNVMRLMENSNEKEDLDKGYDAIDECKNQDDPNDECESAYKMYKCGNERAPVIFGKMVFWEEVASPKKIAPVEITERRICEFDQTFEAKSYADAYKYCDSINMRFPFATTFEHFKTMYDFMNGSTTDNFYLETQSMEDGSEKWCTADDFQVPPEISADKFRLLPEPSILVSTRGTPKYTLTPVLKSQLATSVNVNHFFCDTIPTDV